MSTPFLGLYTAIYHVTDLQAAKAWYTGFLGKPPYFDQPFYVGFNVSGYELGLLPGSAAGSVAYWGVADIEATAAELTAAGHTLSEPITEVGGGIKTAALLDPEGTSIGLIENPHFPNVQG